MSGVCIPAVMYVFNNPLFRESKQFDHREYPQVFAVHLELRAAASKWLLQLRLEQIGICVPCTRRCKNTSTHDTYMHMHTCTYTCTHTYVYTTHTR